MSNNAVLYVIFTKWHRCDLSSKFYYNFTVCANKNAPPQKMDSVFYRSAAALIMIVLITAFDEKGQE
jgi:hypothetical protein